MLVLAAGRTLGLRWVALLAAAGALDGVGILVGGVAALIGAVGTLLSGIALFQKGREAAHKAKHDETEEKYVALLERENERLRTDKVNG